jgi:hypothetical protein
LKSFFQNAPYVVHGVMAVLVSGGMVGFVPEHELHKGDRDPGFDEVCGKAMAEIMKYEVCG